MTQLPPELRVEIRKVGDDQYLAVTERANGQEICSNTFEHDPEKLVHVEPQWMLEKGVRSPDEALRWSAETASRPPDDELLVTCGQRLYGYLFGDGTDLQNFFRFNDAYRRQARLTLCLHPDAAALYRLPWEYLHDGDQFLCLSGRLLVNRLPEGLGELSPPETAPPLRILVVIAGPEDQAELNVERELAVITDALDDAQREGLVTLEVLDYATLPALQDTLSRGDYHVLHYTGHGAYDEAAGQGHLCFENEVGETAPVSADDLRPLLIGERDLRLVVLSACQSAQTGGLDAFGGVATGLLQADLPAVLAMQFSILDSSAIDLARVLYTELARGRTPAQALQRVRLAMRNLDKQRESQYRRFDWGVPALYLRAQGMRLVDPDATFPEAPSFREGQKGPRDLGGLVLPRVFVGRRSELRQMHHALRDRLPAIYVRGIGGIGKTTLAARLLDRPGIDLDDTLVIRCNQLSLPADALSKLANFWQAQGKAGHAEAAALLLDSSHDPEERARRALQTIADRRYLVVFDNLESWFEKPGGPDVHVRAERAKPSGLGIQPPQGALFSQPDDSSSGGSATIADETVRAALRGLLTARSQSTFLFTGRFSWAGLETLPPQNRLAIHLPELPARQTLLLMNALPRLGNEPLEDKLAAYKLVGGHPKTIELLDGWLAGGRTLRALLDDPTLGDRLAEQWEDYFLGELLARLTPAGRDALTTLAILERPFWWQMARDLLETDRPPRSSETSEVSEMLDYWLDLSLIQFHAPGTKAPWYTLHLVVREYLLGQLDEEAVRALHERAAAYYGAPFVEVARQAVAEGDEMATDEEIEALARDRNGVVGRWTHQTQDMQRARWAMERALAWQEHLFQAGEFAAAGEIVTAVVLVLHRWGQRDLAKSLLRRSIETLESDSDRAVAQGNLATMLKNEGWLEEALATYEQVYETFAALDAKQQMAATLNMQSQALQGMGEYDQAIEKQEASLRIKREIENEEGQAISLHQLSMLYRMKEDYETALARSRDAEEIDRRRGDLAGLAADLHEQGLIFNALDRHDEAFARFRESLKIKRRIGNESGAAQSLIALGTLLRDAGQMREAIDAFNEALEIHRRLGSPNMGIALEHLGIVHEMQGEYAAALEKYQQARLICQQAYPAGLPIIEQSIARVRGKMGG
jgi:tetratricopeptide (TPR) repeat protein